MIPIAEPNLTGKEKEYVTDAIASGWVSGGGPYVERFEAMVAEACGKRHCIATITGTAALHAAMRVLGFEGDILVPEYTFSASRNAIRMLGGRAIPRLDPGINYDEGEIFCMSSCRQRLTDAAPAVGCLIGEWDVETLSFNGNKTITTGQGGAILTDDSDLDDAIRTLIRQTQYAGEFNYRMANLNAAMGCAQMERLEEFLAKKREIWDRYQSAEIPVEDAGASRWMCIIAEGPFPENDPPFEHKNLWNTECWCLPCSTNLTTDQQDEVIKCVSSL